MKKVVVAVIALAVLAFTAAAGWADTFHWVPAQGSYASGGEEFAWSGRVLMNDSLAPGSQAVFLVADAWCHDCGRSFRILGTPENGSFTVYSMGHEPAFTVAMEVTGLKVALAK